MGMTYLFKNIANTNINRFKHTVKIKLKDTYEEKWKESLFSTGNPHKKGSILHAKDIFYYPED